MTLKDEKSLVWIGSSKKDLLALPVGVRKFFGHTLDVAQRGISTPKQDLDLIRARLKIAEAIAWELRHGEAHQ
jgi:phage-related protein